MEFGVQFFPDVAPDQVPARQYFEEALRLVELAEPLGYRHVRMVEHHFDPYGGYSPNPLLFLSAASQRTTSIRLITGALLPAFNHPLRLAGEIAMLDAISGGRVEAGFARAFLPHEFARFGVALDESRGRFDEGLEAVRMLLEGENVAFEGRFHRFGPTTTLPRPTQLPRPPFWIAALATEASFENAGRLGHGIMAVAMAAPKMRSLLEVYRAAWIAARHPGKGRVMLAFHMYCHPDAATAVRIARGPIDRYLQTLVAAAADWTQGTSSKDYPGYGEIIAALREDSFEKQVAKGAAWVGTPAAIREQIADYTTAVGGFESASLQVNTNDLAHDLACESMELFAHDVVPYVSVDVAPSPQKAG